MFKTLSDPLLVDPKRRSKRRPRRSLTPVLNSAAADVAAGARTEYPLTPEEAFAKGARSQF